MRSRRSEIDLSALARARLASAPAEVSDAAFEEGLRAALGATVAYLLGATEVEGATAPLPVALRAHARAAALRGVGFGAIARQCFAAYSVLEERILEQAGHDGALDLPELFRRRATRVAAFDRLLAALGEEHRSVV